MTSRSLPSNGQLVHGLIEQHLRSIVEQQGPVLANKDPEPLHQMRVSMRRLRVTLDQFEPLLVLPESLQRARLAKTARRLGLARDLDVQQQLLEQHWLPQLEAKERKLLRPVLKQLRQERQQAHRQVAEQLKSGAYLAWLAQMQRWLRQPQWTPLAQEPASDWLVHWQLSWIAALFVHPGWRLEGLHSGAAHEQLHDLRKAIKRARYQLDNCHALLGQGVRPLQREFKDLQQLLGELNDLEVLQQALEDQLPGSLATTLPHFHALLSLQQERSWLRWRERSRSFAQPNSTQRLLGQLTAACRTLPRRRLWLLMCSWLHPTVVLGWRRV